MKFLRKTVIGIGTLAMTAVCLTSTTYAWFKINSEAKVEGFNLNVTGGNGFMVSIDGVNYANDLKKEDIFKAMVVKYAPDRYLLHFNEEKNETYVYYKMQKTDNNGPVYEVDEEGKQILDEEGNPIPVYDLTDDNIVSDKEIATTLKNIELLPVTSKDGVKLTDLYNSAATATSGRFVEFTVYFKTVSDYKGKYVKPTTFDPDVTYYKDAEGNPVDVEVTKDNYKNYYIHDGYTYDIYLNGDTTYSDAKNGQEAIKISPTKFVSKSTDVQLSANMTAVQNATLTQINKGESITVYTANALRLSITDEKMLAQNPGEGTNIYELNDFVNGAADLGSYATTYSDLYDSSSPEYSIDLDYKYGYKNNAMYTYYSNLKEFTSLNNENNTFYKSLYSYEDMPTTIKDLTSKGADGNYLYNKKITTLSSGEDGKQITFRIWLEGWDADCFDGLTESVSTSLSFSSKRIY